VKDFRSSKLNGNAVTGQKSLLLIWRTNNTTYPPWFKEGRIQQQYISPREGGEKVVGGGEKSGVGLVHSRFPFLSECV